MEPMELAPEAVWAYQKDLGRLARHLCRHPQDAEDVAQSALLKAVQHLDGFRAEASLRTWLHRVATNECRMLRRRKTPISLDTLVEEPDLEAGPKVGADRFDPEQAVVEAERRAAVLRSLKALPARYRTVVLLKDGRGLSAKAVAEATGTTVSAVRSRLHRARSLLRRDLRDRLGEDW